MLHEFAGTSEGKCVPVDFVVDALPKTVGCALIFLWKHALMKQRASLPCTAPGQVSTPNFNHISKSKTTQNVSEHDCKNKSSKKCFQKIESGSEKQ